MIPMSEKAPAQKVISTVEQAKVILYQEKVKGMKEDVDQKAKMTIQESIKPKMRVEAPKIISAPDTATSSTVSLLGKGSMTKLSAEKPKQVIEAPRIIQQMTERPRIVQLTENQIAAKDNDYLKMM